MLTNTGDEGFGIVEVLVGLAIASIALLALSTILSFVSTAQGRVIESEAVIKALVDAKALAGELDNYRTSVATSSPELVILTEEDSAEPFLTLDIAGEQLTAVLDGRQFAQIDLSIFDQRTLEYFSRAGDTQFSWRPLSGDAASDALLIRVSLEKGPRTWSVVLWVRNSSPGPLAVLGGHFIPELYHV